VEIALGVGDMIGPALSGVFYALFGFTGTFIIFSSMILVGTLFSIFLIPSSLNNLTSDIENDQLNDSLINEREIKENGSFHGSKENS
jgi:hypothetical protein